MSSTEKNQPVKLDMASMKKTIEAQDNQLKEHANDINLLQPYRDQAIAAREALLNGPLAKMSKKTVFSGASPGPCPNHPLT